MVSMTSSVPGAHAQAEPARTDLEMLTFFRSTPCSSSDRAKALKCIVPAR